MRQNKKMFAILITFLGVTLAHEYVAAGVVPHVFQPNTPAMASEVNENFSNLADRIGDPINLDKYFNSNASSKTYITADGGTLITNYTYVSDVILHEVWELVGSTYKQTWIYEDRDDGYYQMEIGASGETLYDHYILVLPKGQTRRGDSWGDGYLWDGGRDGTFDRGIAYMYTVLGVESVTVPAGTFSNCLKLYRDRGSNGSSSVHWLAPGIGVIKLIYSANDVWIRSLELTSYEER